MRSSDPASVALTPADRLGIGAPHPHPPDPDVQDYRIRSVEENWSGHGPHLLARVAANS